MKRCAWVVLALVACTSEGKPPPKPAAAPKPVVTDPAAPDFVMPALPIAKVTLTDAFKGSHVVESEVCATATARTRGMMWRTSLDAGKGMLFVFPQEQPLSFWMRNTLIPLDMIFIGKDLKVTGVVANAEPKTMNSRHAGGPAMYVLEVPGGWAEKAGIQPGLPVKIDGIAGLEVTP